MKGVEILVADHPINPRTPLQRAVDFGPIFAFDAAPPRLQIFLLVPRPQFALRQLPAEFADAAAHIVAIKGERATVVPHAPNQQVNVLVVGVVMIDRDPLQPCAQVPLHLRHQVAHVPA